ncbi:MAG: peptidylprolyl isomerase, partial [Woeseiaceae bacterium]|nr:peptidylprolyl isomerase [Woeseiaceae bacterium]
LEPSYLGPGMMVPEFDKVVFSAEVNKVQGPVKTQFGYHLLEVTSRTE